MHTYVYISLYIYVHIIREKNNQRIPSASQRTKRWYKYKEAIEMFDLQIQIRNRNLSNTYVSSHTRRLACIFLIYTQHLYISIYRSLYVCIVMYLLCARLPSIPFCVCGTRARIIRRGGIYIPFTHTYYYMLNM